MRPIKTIGEIFGDVKIGGTPPREKSEYFGGGLPWVSIKDMGKGKYVSETNETLSESGVQNSNVKLIKKGSLLFSFKLTVGRMCFAGTDLYTNEAIAAFEPNPQIMLEYLYYILPIATNQVKRTNNFGAPLLNKDGIKKLEIPLPPLETQKAIVAKLDQIFAELDQTKSEIQKNLDNTDELWKSALNQAFQGDWEVKKLGEIYDITSSKRVFQKDWRTSGVPFYRAREIVKLAENGFVDNELFITEEMYEEYGKKYGLPKENDIMVTGVGTIGICYFVKKTDKFYFKDGNILWFKHNFEGINSRFVEYLFKSELLKLQINNGSSTVVATLTIEKAKGLTIPVPPLSEQEKIVEYLDQVSNEVKQLKSEYQSQLDHLDELKKSVLDKAFRGELE